MHGLSPCSRPSMGGIRKTLVRRRNSHDRISCEGCVRSILRFKLLERGPHLHAGKPYRGRRNPSANSRSWGTAAIIMEAKLGGAGNSRRGSAGGQKTDQKAAGSKSSSTSITSSSITAGTTTTKCSKCQTEGYPHTLCPKKRCDGEGHSAGVCPNTETAVMVYQVVSDG